MSAKAEIMARLKRSLAVPADDGARAATVAKRLADAPAGIIPARGQLPDDARITLFETMAAKAAATTVRIADVSELPAAVADYLRSRNLPASLRMGGDALLQQAGWDSQPHLDIRRGASDGTDLAGLSHARAGIAETATLVLASGPDNPTTINFLPEHHIVAIRAEDIGPDMETAMAAIRSAWGKGSMPRALNFVTGPSRSGDIEQTIILGAHGPRALHIVIIG